MKRRNSRITSFKYAIENTNNNNNNNSWYRKGYNNIRVAFSCKSRGGHVLLSDKLLTTGFDHFHDGQMCISISVCKLK